MAWNGQNYPTVIVDFSTFENKLFEISFLKISGLEKQVSSVKQDDLGKCSNTKLSVKIHV